MLFLTLTLAFIVGAQLVILWNANKTIDDQMRQIHDLRIQLTSANMEISELLDTQPDPTYQYHRMPEWSVFGKRWMEKN